MQKHCQYSRENRTIATIDPFPFQTEDDCYDGVSGKQKKRVPSPGFVLFKMSAGLDVAGQLDLHVAKQRDHLELL